MSEQELKEQLTAVLNENYSLLKQLRNLKSQVIELQYELARAPTRVNIRAYPDPKESK